MSVHENTPKATLVGNYLLLFQLMNKRKHAFLNLGKIQ